MAHNSTKFIDLLEQYYFRAARPSFAQSYRQTARRVEFDGVFVPSLSSARRLVLGRCQAVGLSLARQEKLRPPQSKKKGAA